MVKWYEKHFASKNVSFQQYSSETRLDRCFGTHTSPGITPENSPDLATSDRMIYAAFHVINSK